MLTKKSDYAQPFNLAVDDDYKRWRDIKLKHYPEKAEQLLVEIRNPKQLTKAEKEAITERYKKTNMAIYISPSAHNPDKTSATKIAAQFGLKTLDKNMGADDDGITSLTVSSIKGRERYIPYSNKAIHWHTDGYYNKLSHQIHALNLHCVNAAKNGGENAVMDHEMAYIQLREENPDFIHALMAADAMTIPANIKDGITIRPARCGAVFSSGRNTQLHMRYTERSKSVIWKDNDITRAAVAALETILHSNSPYIYRLTLQPGWGLISNNVLHDRSSFEDDKQQPRLIYRLRYYEGLN